MSRKALIIVMIVVAVLALGGVFLWNNKNASAPSSETTSTDNSSSQQPNNSTDQSSAADNIVHTGQVNVDISNFAFAPANVTIKKGSTIVWTNNDSSAHTVTPDNPSNANGFGSEELSNGESYSFLFGNTGNVSYHCAIHPSMKGTITVVD